MKHLCITLISVVCLACSSCKPHTVASTYVIGVSLDNSDDWHDRMRDEIVQEVVLHPDLQMIYRNAWNDRHRQSEQVDSLVGMGVDALIISVENPMYIHQALQRAYEQGVKVIINSRNPNFSLYTAYVGTDNRAIGRMMADYLLQQARLKGFNSVEPLRYIEILGVPGVPAVEERYAGMHGVLSMDSITFCVASFSADWRGDLAYRYTDSVLCESKDVDIIVAQNDVMALGAREALHARYPNSQCAILGIDALSGEGRGVEAILEGKIAASITNITRGDLMVQVAAQILHGEPFTRDSLLQPQLVDGSSQNLMRRMSQEMMSEDRVIRTLQTKVDGLWLQTLNLETTNLTLSLLLLTLIILVSVLVFGYFYRIRVQKERAKNALFIEQQRKRLEQVTAELERVKTTQDKETLFTDQLQRLMEVHMDDTQYGVDEMCNTLGVSRAQLFRRTKQALGVTPIDLLRQVRLRKARQLLLNTDMSIQQIAYAVGYSLPSYFSKCYRQQFGVNPSQENRSRD